MARGSQGEFQIRKRAALAQALQVERREPVEEIHIVWIVSELLLEEGSLFARLQGRTAAEGAPATINAEPAARSASQSRSRNDPSTNTAIAAKTHARSAKPRRRMLAVAAFTTLEPFVPDARTVRAPPPS